MASERFSSKSRGHAWRGFLLATAVLLLASAACVRADDQDNQQVAAILTSGTWRIMDSGQLLMRVFKPDGTFSSVSGFPSGFTVRAAHPADHKTGQWKIANGRVIITFDNDTAMQEIFLPITQNFARVVDERGMPSAMTNSQRAMTGPAQNGLPVAVAPPPPANPAPEETPAVTATATPAGTPQPVSPSDQELASQLVQKYSNSLVFVDGKAGAGSGFIAKIGTGNFLVTNVHVVAGIRDAAFKTLDGAAVQAGAGAMAVGEDIFAMSMPASAKPFEIMQGVDTNAAIGDTIVVLGNAEGAGVVNTITGKIVGIGPNLVEIDAPFVPGNSGSPIIHLKTGKVIGVATYLVTNQYDLTTKKRLQQPVVRRFGYRVDSVKHWQAVNWNLFYAQAVEMESIEKLTDDLYDFFRDLNEHNGRVTVDRHSNPVIKDRIGEWLEEKRGNRSDEDRREADANFISFLKLACQQDVQGAQRQMSYDYFARELNDQWRTRTEMQAAFGNILKNIGE